MLKLEGFSKEKIVLVFPCNFVKQDPDSKQVEVFECLSNIHAIDSSGSMFVFNLDENLKDPVKTAETLPEQGCVIINCFYNMQTSMIHSVFRKDG